MGVVAFVAVVVAVAAPLCGHQTQPFPPRAWRQTLQARQARQGRCTPATGPHSPFRLPRSLRGTPEPARARTTLSGSANLKDAT